MTFVVADRVKDSTTTTGTGTITLSGTAPNTFQTFGSVMATGDVCFYCIAGQTGTDWETGYGTYTTSGTTLSRDVIISSSNSNAAVSLAAGTHDVFLVAPAKEMPYQPPFEFAVNDYMNLGSAVGNGVTQTTTGSSVAVSNNLAVYVPFVLSRPRKSTGMAVACSALNAGASAVVRLGIHNDNAGRPGTVAQDAGTSSLNATGLKTMSFSSVTLMPGNYWAVLATQSLDTAGANPSFNCNANSFPAVGDPSPSATGSDNAYLSATVSGALANNPTVSISRVGTAGKGFHIWLLITG